MISAPSIVVRKLVSTTFAIPIVAAGLMAASPPAALAQDANATSNATAPTVQGLWLTTEYPEFSAQASDKISVDLSLTNKALPPQRVALGINGLPDGWHWDIEGGGHAVSAAIAQTDKTVDLTLNLTPPKGAKKSDYKFDVTANADGNNLDLPISLTLTDTEPAKLTLTPELPALRGSVHSSFDFKVTAKNEGQQDTTVNLLAKAPPGFDVTFKEEYGSQELTSLPLPAGKSKDLKVSVKPPESVEAGQYPVMIAASGGNVSAEQQLVLDVTGEPKLALSGPGGRLSGDATAGQKRTFNFTLDNTGTAAAKDISFSAGPPQGWDVTFSPDKIDQIEPGKSSDVAVSMTPSQKAIAGDYVVSVRANGGGASDDQSFRVTVGTSTIWGIAGLGVIAAAVIVLGFGVSRYGRR